MAITLQNDGAGNITILVPNHSSSIVQDSIGALQWIHPRELRAFGSTWIAACLDDVTLILDDDDPSNPLDPDAWTFPVDAGDVSSVRSPTADRLH